ncbi:hypothetical protein Pfo_010256 [Paulownia fortunei]|nr:hypothetical protein Pfo_010256 [Paulownia fortunei]
MKNSHVRLLLKVQMIPCDSKGSILYEFACLEIFELKKNANCIHYETFEFQTNIHPFNCIFSFTSFVTVKKLIKVLEVNLYAKFIRILKDYPLMYNVQQHISKDMKLYQRVYSSPIVDEVRYDNIKIIKSLQPRNPLFQHIMSSVGLTLQLVKVMLDKKKLHNVRIYIYDYVFKGFPHAHMLIIFEYPKLNYLVAKHMMHGLYGHENLNNCRMVDEKCKFHYLLPYCESTIQGKDGYIQSIEEKKYRLIVQVRNTQIKNKCMTEVKYLYKYKRHDRLAIHMNIRWAFAQEATWKTFEFNLNERYPTFINLHFYLLNQRLKKSRKYLFGEFLEHYKRDVIRHINTTNPIEGKRYYLMLLMNHVFKIFSRFSYRCHFFIDESSEIGKTFLYCALFAHLRSKNLIALASATSEIAATIIPRVHYESSEFTMSKWNIDKLLKFIMENNKNLCEENDHSTHYMTSRAILVAKNEHVYKLNDKLIFLFPKEVGTFNNYDEVIDDTNNYYAKDFLNFLTQNGLFPHKMMLKRNCPIILLRYLDPSNELLCFAMTIKKVLGQMIPNVGFYLPHPVFSHDQLYIAISRGTPISTLKVLIKLDTTNVREKTLTKNVIYRQVSSLSTNFFRLSNILYIINIFLLGKKQH